jgi:hypothetical protein
MGKDSKNLYRFSGQPVLGQMLKLIDRGMVKETAVKFSAEWYVKKFTSWHHLVALLFGMFTRCDSLREIVCGLLPFKEQLQQMGVGFKVARSTLGEANARRSSDFFAEVYFQLYERHKTILADSCPRNSSVADLYVLDSSTISLFPDLFSGTGRFRKEEAREAKAGTDAKDGSALIQDDAPRTGRRKGGLKAHTVSRVGAGAPSFMRTSDAVCHDSLYLNELYSLPAGSTVVVDRGYNDYGAFQQFTKLDISYVTRMKKNAVFEVIPWSDEDLARREPEEPDSGVVKDEKVRLFENSDRKIPVHETRRIEYTVKDEKTEKEKYFVFITNNFALPASMIAKIYKDRWQIELLFKALKQNFPLKYFWGDNRNAIETQVWVAFIALLLLRVFQAQTKAYKWRFSNLELYVGRILMSYAYLPISLNDPEARWKEAEERANAPPQLNLFDNRGC